MKLLPKCCRIPARVFLRSETVLLERRRVGFRQKSEREREKDEYRATMSRRQRSYAKVEQKFPKLQKLLGYVSLSSRGRCIDAAASPSRFPFSHVSAEARDSFWLGASALVKVSRGASFFILAPAAMVLNANFGPAGRRRALTALRVRTQRVRLFGTSVGICVRIAISAQTEAQPHGRFTDGCVKSSL
jgi:hypothetical protein